MTENLFNGNNDSSIFKAQIREQDLSAEEKLNELKMPTTMLRKII